MGPKRVTESVFGVESATAVFCERTSGDLTVPARLVPSPTASVRGHEFLVF